MNLVITSAILGLSVYRPCAGAAQAVPSSDEAFSQSLQSFRAQQPAEYPVIIRHAQVKFSKERVIQQAMPSVVQIVTPAGPGGGMGSGFIMLPSGIVATNAHVVENVQAGGSVAVVTPDGESRQGILLAKGTPMKKDIAFIQLPPVKRGWKALPLQPSANIVLGTEVMAMGYPLGLPFSVSRGIVSGLDRKNDYVTLLQTDAAVNPGNSGGPLMTLNGTVVAMDTEILSRSGGSEGMALGIIAEDIIQAWKQYLKIKNLDAPWLGVSINPKLTVLQMYPGSPAKKAGLELDDIITGIGAAPVDSVEEFLHRLHAFMPGETVTFSILRGKTRREIPVVLESEQAVEPQTTAAAETDRLPV
jgi:putative serine protease PepD